MKLQATLIIDVEAASLAEADAQLDELVESAKRARGVRMRDVQLGTPPPSAPVTVPFPLARPENVPAPAPPSPPPPHPTYAPPTARDVSAGS